MQSFIKIITKSCRITGAHGEKLAKILKNKGITFSQWVRQKIENERL